MPTFMLSSQFTAEATIRYQTGEPAATAIRWLL